MNDLEFVVVKKVGCRVEMEAKINSTICTKVKPEGINKSYWSVLKEHR